ncbi:MAG: hypothetical protein M3Q44_06270 [bacterium]|nr:hypothetical protein [bacterium]
MIKEDRFPGVIENALSAIEQNSEGTAGDVRLVCRRLLDTVVLPDDHFGDAVAVRQIRQLLGKSEIVKLHYFNLAAFLPHPREDDPRLKHDAKVATARLNDIADAWKIASAGKLVTAVLALTDSLNSFEEQV